MGFSLVAGSVCVDFTFLAWVVLFFSWSVLFVFFFLDQFSLC